MVRIVIYNYLRDTDRLRTVIAYRIVVASGSQ